MRVDLQHVLLVAEQLGLDEEARPHRAARLAPWHTQLAHIGNPLRVQCREVEAVGVLIPLEAALEAHARNDARRCRRLREEAVKRVRRFGVAVASNRHEDSR